MTVEELKVVIVADAKKLSEELSKAREDVKQFNSDIKSEFKNAKSDITNIFAGLGKKIIGVFAGLQIGKFIVNSVKEAMHAIEDESLTQVAFGKQADAIRDWSKQVSDALGLAVTDVRRNTSTMYTMIRAMNIAETSAMKMAKGVTLLSQDLASMLNKDPKQVYERISAGLMGQTRGLHLMGYAITAASVKQYAYAKGIAEVGSELTEQQKVMARYLLLMEQTKVAHGNLAQTINSPMNQLRMFNANLKDLCQTFGNLFIPILNAVMPYLNAFLKLITMLFDAIRKFFGFKTNQEWGTELHDNFETANYGIQTTNKGVGNLDKNLKKADKDAKKLRETLARFDEMNVLKEPMMKTPKVPKADLGDLGGFGGMPFDFPVEEYNPHIEWVKNKVKELVESFQKYFSGIDFSPLVSSLENLKKSIDPIIGTISSGLKWFMDHVLRPLTVWTIEDLLPAFFNLLAESLRFLQPILDAAAQTFAWWWDHALQPMAAWTGGVIVYVLEMIAKWLKQFNDNASAVEMMRDLVQIVTGLGLALFTVATGLKMVRLAALAFQTILTLLTSPIGLVTLAILAIGVALYYVIKYMPEIKQAFINAFNSIKEAVSKVATWFKNTIKRFFEDPIGAVVDSVKWLISSLSGKKWQTPQQNNSPQYTMPNIPVPKFATGGIVSSPTFAQIGEAGTEAVVPLERNTGWIDMLASKLNGNGQPINLTVKIGEDNIISRVIDGINNKTMEMGRGMVMV